MITPIPLRVTPIPSTSTPGLIPSPSPVRNTSSSATPGTGVVPQPASVQTGPTKSQRRLPALKCAKAQFLIGRWLERGNLGWQKPTWAGVLFRRAAEQGLAEAQLSLALLLQYGVGMPQDSIEAEKWYLAAAGQGNPAAQAGLADFQASMLGMDAANMSSIVRAYNSLDASARTKARNMARATMQTALERFVRDHNRAEAQRGLLEALKQDPGYVQPRFNLGRLAEADENWDGAIRWLEEVLKIAPGTQMAVEASLNIQRLRIAQQMAKTPAGLQTMHYESELEVARNMIDTRDYGGAGAHAKEAIKIDASRYEAYTMLATVHSRLKEHTKALGVLQQALSAAPSDRKPKIQQALDEVGKDVACEKYLSAAAVSLESEKFEEAGQAYESAWRLHPVREGYALRAALAFQLGGLNDRARPILNKLTASKDLSVAQAATNQLLKVKSGGPP